MEKILHHLLDMKSYETWDILNINWCRISSISSTSMITLEVKDMKSGLVKVVFPEFMACYRKVWLIGIYLCLYTPFESKMFNENRPQFWMMR